jgi:hypothetical protein
MKTTLKTLTALTLSTMASAPVLATNGDNLIGIDPTSRSMGGVGVHGGDVFRAVLPGRGI